MTTPHHFWTLRPRGADLALAGQVATVDATELLDNIVRPILGTAVGVAGYSAQLSDPSFGLASLAGAAMGAAAALELSGAVGPDEVAALLSSGQPGWPAGLTAGQWLTSAPLMAQMAADQIAAADAQRAATTNQSALPAHPAGRTALIGAEIGQRAGFPVTLDEVTAWPDRTEVRLRINMPSRVEPDQEAQDPDAARLLRGAIASWETSRLLADDRVLLCGGLTRGFVNNFGHLVTEVFQPVPASCSRIELEVAGYQQSEPAGRAVIQLPS